MERRPMNITLRYRHEDDEDWTWIGPPDAIDTATSTYTLPAEVVALMRERGGTWVNDAVIDWSDTPMTRLPAAAS